MLIKQIFTKDLADKVGLQKAILLEYILYWVMKNARNERNYHQEKYWTYNTLNAYENEFSYMGLRSISRYLSSLEEEGWIETGNFNKMKMDRTLWYTIGQTYIDWMNEVSKDGYKIGKMHYAKSSNGLSQSGGTIPVINPVIKERIKENKKKFLIKEENEKEFDNLIKEIFSLKVVSNFTEEELEDKLESIFIEIEKKCNAPADFLNEMGKYVSELSEEDDYDYETTAPLRH
uniref:Uncharacterized protein n=1 Tax=viral metagenome TaxID=1070528 RepID=A0A6M3MAS7_9ZZZZ